MLQDTLVARVLAERAFERGSGLGVPPGLRQHSASHIERRRVVRAGLRGKQGQRIGGASGIREPACERDLHGVGRQTASRGFFERFPQFLNRHTVRHKFLHEQQVNQIKK